MPNGDPQRNENLDNLMYENKLGTIPGCEAP